MKNEEYAKIVSKNLKRLAFVADKTRADISRELRIPKSLYFQHILGAWLHFGCMAQKKEGAEAPSNIRKTSPWSCVLLTS